MNLFNQNSNNENLTQQQQMYMQQQMMNNQFYGNYSTGSMSVTRKMLLDYMSSYLGACEVITVDDFGTPNTRHICRGTAKIKVLSKINFNIPTPKGIVCAEIFWCPNCRKLIVNRNSLDVI